MSEVIQMTKPGKSLNDFLDQVSEDDLLAALDDSSTPQLEVVQHERATLPSETPTSTSPLETNSRLTIVKMFEQAPDFHQPFTFKVKRYRGEAFVQAMRTTLAKARKIAKEENYDLGEEFKMIVLDMRTEGVFDTVTVTRIPKGKKNSMKLTALAKMMGGSDVKGDEDD